jgi:hypothetical protein
MFINFFFPENGAIYDMTKNVVEPEGTRMASQYGAHDLYAG